MSSFKGNFPIFSMQSKWAATLILKSKHFASFCEICSLAYF